MKCIKNIHGKFFVTVHIINSEVSEINNEDITSTRIKTRHLIFWVKTAVCLIVILVLLIIKLIGGELYENVHEYIDGLLSNSAVIDIETDQ